MENGSGKIKCPNCEKEFDSSFNYCPHCGQKNTEPDPKLKHFISEFLSANFNLDSKIFHTLKSLVLRPAELSNEFIAGKRKKYITPVRLYLFISLVYFFVLSINTDNGQKIVEINDKGVVETGSSNSLISIDSIDTDSLDTIDRHIYDKLQLLKNPTGQKIFKQTIKKNISLGMFIFIPLTAFILYILFRRRIKYYIPNLIFAIHLQSLIFLWFTILNLIDLIIEITALKIAVLLFILFMIFRWIKTFYGTSTGKTLWKMTIFMAAWFSLLIIFLVVVLALSFWFIN